MERVNFEDILYLAIENVVRRAPRIGNFSDGQLCFIGDQSTDLNKDNQQKEQTKTIYGATTEAK